MIDCLFYASDSLSRDVPWGAGCVVVNIEIKCSGKYIEVSSFQNLSIIWQRLYNVVAIDKI